MDKPTIICIVGESGSGKTLIADYLDHRYGYEIIESRTTRPQRTPDEDGHTFVSQEEFDSYDKDEMIAFTTFGGYNYCCLKKDVKDKNTYVIDEHGLKYLKENFSRIYNIYSIRVHRDYHARVRAVGRDRVDRDKGKFTMDDKEFDWVIENEEGNIGVCLWAVDLFMEYHDLI